MIPTTLLAIVPLAPCLASLPAGGAQELEPAVAGVERPTEEGQVLPLSLEQALAIGLERDLGLQIQELASEAARFRYEGSFGVFDPLLGATVEYSDAESEAFSLLQGNPVIEEQNRTFTSSLLYPLTTGGDLSLDYLLTETETNSELVQSSDSAVTDIISLTFRQPLLRGAGTTYTLSEQREARLTYRREIQSQRLTYLDLLQGVEDAYWDLVAALAQLRVAQESLALSEQQLDQNRRRLEAGVGTEVEVLQSEADRATKREQLLARDVAVKDAADVLKMRLFPGIDTLLWSAEIEPTTELPEIRTDDVPPWQAAMAVALERRPDLARARLDIEAAEERLLRAESEQRAQLDLRLSSSSRGFDAAWEEALEKALGWDFPTHTAALSFSYPIGNRAANGAARAARAELRSARLSHDQVQSNVVSEVRTSHRRVLYEAEVVNAALTSTELARRQLEAEEARFREGLSTNFQVLEFQEDLTLAQFTLVQARAEFAKARAALARAQGILGDSGRTP